MDPVGLAFLLRLGLRVAQHELIPGPRLRAVATQKKFYSKWCTGTREQVETWKAPKRSETITSIHIQMAKASHLIKTKVSLCPLQVCGWWEELKYWTSREICHGQAQWVRDTGKIPKRKQQIHRTESCLERLAHRGLGENSGKWGQQLDPTGPVRHGKELRPDPKINGEPLMG